MLWVRISTFYDKVTCDRSVVFSGSSGFPHQWNWPPRYSWNIVESGIKHHQTNNHWTSIKWFRQVDWVRTSQASVTDQIGPWTWFTDMLLIWVVHWSLSEWPTDHYLSDSLIISEWLTGHYRCGSLVISLMAVWQVHTSASDEEVIQTFNGHSNH